MTFSEEEKQQAQESADQLLRKELIAGREAERQKLIFEWTLVDIRHLDQGPEYSYGLTAIEMARDTLAYVNGNGPRPAWIGAEWEKEAWDRKHSHYLDSTP